MTVQGPPNYSYWTRDAFSGDIVEAWMCTSGGQLGAAVETWRIALLLDDPAQFQGYLGYFGGGITKEIVIRQYDDVGTQNVIAQGALPGGAYPEMIGLRINGDAVEFWAMITGTWALYLTVNDTTYRGAFYLVIGTEDPTGGGLSISCFGGGVKNRTQIYRVIRGLADVAVQ